jgi:phage-related protein
MKSLNWIGDTKRQVRNFPESARNEAGYQLWRIQMGRDPNDWKPMPGVGAGVREVRIRDEAGAFRVIYIARLPEAIYVLHAFQKKTQKTEKRDIELATARLSAVLKERQ